MCVCVLFGEMAQYASAFCYTPPAQAPHPHANRLGLCADVASQWEVNGVFPGCEVMRDGGGGEWLGHLGVTDSLVNTGE